MRLLARKTISRRRIRTAMTRQTADAVDEEQEVDLAAAGPARAVEGGAAGARPEEAEAEARTSPVVGTRMLQGHGGTIRRCRRLPGGRDDLCCRQERRNVFISYIACQVYFAARRHVARRNSIELSSRSSLLSAALVEAHRTPFCILVSRLDGAGLNLEGSERIRVDQTGRSEDLESYLPLDLILTRRNSEFGQGSSVIRPLDLVVGETIKLGGDVGVRNFDSHVASV